MERGFPRVSAGREWVGLQNIRAAKSGASFVREAAIPRNSEEAGILSLKIDISCLPPDDNQMDPIELTVREHLSEEAQSSTEGVPEIQSFCEKTKEDSLNLKVHEALAFRKQGHFDKAMLNISEVNRDQVTAIRRIQSLIGQVRSERCPEVVFEKFRQFEPFEIGISDADAVLAVLAEFDDEKDLLFKESKLKLHDTELCKKDAENYVSFLENRMNNGSSSEEIAKTMESVILLDQTLTEQRKLILVKVFVVAGKIMKKMPSGIEKNRIFLELSLNIFLVILSPIMTKSAAYVETEI